MANPKRIYSSINIPGEADDMFNYICRNMLGKRPADVKREVLKLDGSIKELEEHKASLSSVITLILAKELKFELMVVGDKREMEKAPPVTEAQSLLEKQKSEVKPVEEDLDFDV